MARAFDQAKWREWTKRLERFRAGGTTVAQFCSQERVSVSTFYYWAKRVGSVAPLEQRHDLGDVFRPAPRPGRAGTRYDGAGPAAPAKIAVEELVRFRFGSVEVDVPAGCLDVIRCLAESVGRFGTQATPDAFHEIALGGRGMPVRPRCASVRWGAVVCLSPVLVGPRSRFRETSGDRPRTRQGR